MRGACLAFGILLTAANLHADEVKVPSLEFTRDIQPILAKACFSCHGDTKQRGSLRLDQKKTAFEGGDTGPSLVAGDASASLLLRRITAKDPRDRMPPKDPALTADEIALVKRWIEQGARWEEKATGVAKTNPRDWWSLKPLVRPAAPAIEDPWIRNPIDAFILEHLHAKKMTPAREADRRTLIRRLSYDLIGLPPAPEEVEAFVRDNDPRAYDKLVDRLLASSGYGERWARHWLDVVHYGDTHGYDKDKPRPNAWPYRDYVIRAFNNDKPYRRFIEEQIAGDILYPGTPDGIEALGFIATGPWDFIGHAEQAETRIDGKIARHIDRDDMISNLSSTFLSLTLHCAQCHHHKFDPIQQEDYYRMQAVFAALDRADRRYDSDPIVAQTRHTLQQRKADAEATLKKLESAVLAKLAPIDAQIAQAKKTTGAAPRPEYGYHSALTNNPLQAKWIQLDLGASATVAQIQLVGCFDTFNNIGEGFGFPLRYKVEMSDDPGMKEKVHTVADFTAADVPNPGTLPQLLDASSAKGRYLRVTATKLASRLNDYHFALAEIAVLDTSGKNLAKSATVSALDSIEAPPRWSKKNLIDGIAFQKTTIASNELARLMKLREEAVRNGLDATQQMARDDAAVSLQKISADLAKLPAQKLVYSGTVHTGTGNFVGTGAKGGAPRPIYLLPRGDVKRPGKEVGPGAIDLFPDLPAVFDLPEDHREGDRRAALAKWVASENNPLTWRSIVNRVWLYHMGRGIVDSPNDFGRMGQMPTHQALLDWLAVEFRDGGQSFKKLHRLIVTSATYRQASNTREFDKIDAGNQYYWRGQRRRLEAEAIRDSVLAVAGKLDGTMGGPSFQDFIVERPEHSPHYQYHLHDPEDVKTHRRSIYRFVVRSQQQPFLTTMDCADPSMLVEKRNQTITPLQALALLNNNLMLVMAKHFAARLERESDTLGSQVERGLRLTMGRAPSAEERRVLVAYARDHGLANLCRVLFNLNEFVFVD